MTVNTPRKNKRTRKPRPQARQRAKSASVRVVDPNTTPAAIERGRQKAALVRRELAAQRRESLNEAMTDLRGREWS